MTTKQTLILEQINEQRNEIEAWFEAEWKTTQPAFYTSVDLRHSGCKLAPVDVNLYPAGFNNLSLPDQAYAAIQVEKLLRHIKADCKRILIITENHTRNLYYLEHLFSLQNILKTAGFSVKLSTLSLPTQTVTTLSGHTLLLESVKKQDDYLRVGDFIPDCIILNNDLSEGLPEWLSSAHQPIVPSPALGWYQRKKSQYFSNYHSVSQAFSTALGWDNWLINPLFDHCDQVDFTQGSEQTELIQTAQKLLDKITEKYDFYHLQEKPYLIIKADSGSYGMGVLVVEKTSDIATLSRKQRQHMAKTKGNRPIQSVILQEGIPTITHWNETVAEPVVYLFGSEVVGGFYRTHTSRSTQENLNTPGMELTPLTFHGAPDKARDASHYAYQVIARLSALAAAFEMKGFK